MYQVVLSSNTKLELLLAKNLHKDNWRVNLWSHETPYTTVPKEGHWKFQGERSFLRPLNLNIQGKGCKTSDQKHIQWKGCEYFMKPCKWHKNLHYKYISAMLFYLIQSTFSYADTLGKLEKLSVSRAVCL